MTLFRKKEKPLYIMRSDGNIEFKTKSRINAMEAKPDTVWNHTFILCLIVLICMAVDFFNFKQVFDSFLLDRPLARAAGILAFLIAFDVLPIWIGLNLKKKSQGYKINAPVLIMMIGVFVLGFAANLALRAVTKTMVIPPDSIFSGGINGEVQAPSDTGANPELALVYAAVAIIIPLITSIASGTVSYLISDPLKKHMLKLEKEHDVLTGALQYLSATEEEYKKIEDTREHILKREEEKYEEAKMMVIMHSQYLKDYVREQLAIHLADPVSTNVLSKTEDRSEAIRKEAFQKPGKQGIDNGAETEDEKDSKTHTRSASDKQGYSETLKENRREEETRETDEISESGRNAA